MDARVGPFRIEAFLGKGTMGTVWRGRHNESGQEVAIKMLFANASDQQWLQKSFAAEVRAVARLHHPNIVMVVDKGVVSEADRLPHEAGTRVGPGSNWLAMELLTGVSMFHARARCTWPLLLGWIRDLLDGLAHAHARGLLHRDLKPGNVMIADKRAVLVDFGLAREWTADPSVTHDGQVVGTPPYMAPEQFFADDAAYGPWTDMYALGCSIWAMLAGTPPFGLQGQLPRHREAHCGQPVPPLMARMVIPPGIEAWLRRLLAKDPLDRFRSAADARWGLHRVLAGGVFDDRQPLPREVPPFSVRWPSASGRADTGETAEAGLNLFGLRTPPLLGRTVVQERLWDALRDVGLGQPQVLVLTGEPGNGKSSILRWLAEAASETGAALPIWVRHGEEPSAGDGVVPAVARALGLSHSDRTMALDRLAGWAQRAGVPDTLHADLADLLLGGARRRRSVAERHALLVDTLDYVARERPVLLCVDDVQWGLDTLAFVLRLCQREMPVRPRVLVVMTTRPLPEKNTIASMFGALLDLPGAESLPVGPLAPGMRAHLVNTMAKVEPGLVQHIDERAGGNPLFVVELLRDWVGRGLLVPVNGVLCLRPGANPALPPNIHAVWQSRIESALAAFGEAERATIELAAVLGVNVDREEWSAACRAATLPTGERALDALLTAGLVVPDRHGTDRGFSFAHAMLRESLLHASEAAGRLRGQRQACVQMLQVYADQHPRAALRLGQLLLLLGRPADAIAPLGRGAWAAVRDSEFLLAERVLADRAAAMQQLRVPPEDPLWGEGWLMETRVARRRGDAVAARRATASILEMAGSQVLAGPYSERWRVCFREAHREAGRLAMLDGDVGLALVHAASALTEAAHVRDALALAWCRRDVAMLRVQVGARLAEVDGLLAAAQTTFEAEGEGYGMGDCLRARALLRRRELRSADAEPLYRTAKRVFRRCLTTQEPAHTYVALGEVALGMNQPAEAIRWFSAARERFAHIGHPGPVRLPWREATARLDRGDAAGARKKMNGHSCPSPAWAGALRARLLLAEGNPEGCRMVLQTLILDAEPEAAEQLEVLARAARKEELAAISSAAATLASQLWSTLGFGARARRALRLGGLGIPEA